MAQKRVLIVHNFDKTELGNIGQALSEADVAVDTVRAHHGEKLPDTSDGHDALIVLGGGQNALDDSGSPYFPALLDMIRAFESRDRPVLGVCLGSQLMARAFGGGNRIGGHTEFGWHDIHRADSAETDAVLAALPASFPIFQWHDDSFDLPPGATRLASSSSVENQAFRVGRAAYGFQFHFEADRRLVSQWNLDFAETLAANRPWWKDMHEGEALKRGPAADAAGLAIARAWVALI